MLEIEGIVSRRMFAEGSKSGRMAIVIDTNDGREFVLRRAGGNPFVDPELDRLVGRSICCSGRIHNYIFLMDSWQ